MHLDLEQFGVLHELQVGHAHGVHSLFAFQTFDGPRELFDDSRATLVVGGDEEILLVPKRRKRYGWEIPARAAMASVEVPA